MGTSMNSSGASANVKCSLKISGVNVVRMERRTLRMLRGDLMLAFCDGSDLDTRW